MKDKKVTNTAQEAKERPGLTLIEMLSSKTPSDSILRQEARGAAELERAEQIPCHGTVGREEPFIKVGFVFLGGPDKGDPIFRPGRLPSGWTLKAGDRDPRHMTLRDDQGRERGLVFYKAAFYDRKASIRLIQRYQVTSRWPYDGTDRFVDVIDVAADDRVLFEVPYQEDREHDPEWYERGEAARKQAEQWLAEHYPDHEDVTAYW